MATGFWKLSMAGNDFKTILEVLDWIRQGVVLVHKDTLPKGISQVSQGEHFVESARLGDYFYLCHGNHEPSVLLLGQFTGPLNLFCERGNGWAERPFRWLRTSVSTKVYAGSPRWWAPNHNSTFIRVPDEQLTEFEDEIMKPYFAIELKEFGITSEA
jgi:hypothetical protein